jgi:hypothetical protein
MLRVFYGAWPGIQRKEIGGMMLNRRFFIFGAAGTAAVGAAGTGTPDDRQYQYEGLRWVEESNDPSVSLETGELAIRIIDNTGLRPRPDSSWMEQGYSHYLGYHGIRALWNKEERRNIVAPFFSWLNLQNLQIEGLTLDPVDPRARFGIGRGWPVQMNKESDGVLLRIPRMPLSGVEYALRLSTSGPDSLDFAVSFVLHEKKQDPASFFASWPCYMSTYEEVQLYSPSGSPEAPAWESFGEPESFVVGETVGYVHSQRTFSPPRPALFPAVYGRIGSRVLAIMASRPEVKFFLVNAGGHRSYLPVQNPAWDLSFSLPDYPAGQAFGFTGRIIYKPWGGADEITARYRQWKERAAERPA